MLMHIMRLRRQRFCGSGAAAVPMADAAAVWRRDGCRP